MLDQLYDPRRTGGNKRFDMSFILAMVIIGLAKNRSSIRAIRESAMRENDILAECFDLSNGFPSEDTIRRVVNMVNPDEFQKIAFEGVKYFNEHIAIDGKHLCGTIGADGKDKNVLSAWCTSRKIVISQMLVPEYTNEITALKLLLQNPNFTKCIITADAIHCQIETAASIINADSDYILTVKQNQKYLCRNIEIYLKWNETKYTRRIVEYKSRRVITYVYGFSPHAIDLYEAWKWPGIQSIGYVYKIVYNKNTDKQTVELRYFISSIANFENFIECVSNHWSIENQLHWHLDVNFGEDRCRLRKGNAPVIFNIIRKLLLHAYSKFRYGSGSITSKIELVQEDRGALVHLLDLIA